MSIKPGQDHNAFFNMEVKGMRIPETVYKNGANYTAIVENLRVIAAGEEQKNKVRPK